MQIPQYTKGLAIRRDTPDTVNLNMINYAGMEARAIEDVAGQAAKISQHIEQSNEASAVNSALIQRQKDDIDTQEKMRKQYASNPLGFSKNMEPIYKKRDDDIAATLPSERAREAYRASASKLNLKNYENDLQWENTRSTEMLANKADNSIKDLEIMAYRGASLEDLNKNRQATAMTLGSVLAPDQIVKFDEKAEQRIVTSYLDGVIDRDPNQAKQLLDSKDFDNALGADKLKTFYDKTTRSIEALENKRLAAGNRATKLRMEDPALLAEEAGISADNYKGKIQYQREIGISDGNISIIPKQRASMMANQLEGVTNSDQFVGELGNIRKQVGDDNFDIAMNDLAKNGLSKEVKLMALMTPEANKSQMEATIAMMRDGDVITKKATAFSGVTVSKIQEAVSGRISDAVDVFSSESGMGNAAQLELSLTPIATYYASKGMSVDDAAKKATDWLNEKIPIAEINGKKFRASPLASPDDLEEALTYAINNTEFEGLQFEQGYTKRTVRPVLDTTETGYYLVYENGLQVKNKNGAIFYDVKTILDQHKKYLKTLAEKEAAESFNDMGD